MEKIKVTSKEKEFVGSITEGKVTPFGTSAHISFPKKHTGKIVNVITPANPDYVWVLSDIVKEKVVNACEKIITKEDGRLEKHRLDILRNIQEPRFKLNDLIKVIEILKKSTKHKYLISKIKKVYNLNGD